MTAGKRFSAARRIRMSRRNVTPEEGECQAHKKDKVTVEVETKFVPFTVRVNAGPPAMGLEGES